MEITRETVGIQIKDEEAMCGSVNMENCALCRGFSYLQDKSSKFISFVVGITVGEKLRWRT